MKFFINDGIYNRSWNGNVKIENLPNGKLKLAIPNYIQGEARDEYINFIFEEEFGLVERDFCENLTLNCRINKTSKNTYHIYPINKGGKQKEECIYALIRSTRIVPDDICIPACMRKNVEVMRRINFVDGEVDYGDFLSNVYLIKIKLKVDESLPVFMNPYLLDDHYVFYRQEWNGKTRYQVTEKLKTHIILSSHNRKKFISLSELCK